LQPKQSNYMLKRILIVLTTIMAFALTSFGQNTTSSMTGVVKGANGDPLVGATVTLTHLPTGTVFKTQTKTGGRFDINNANPGGPYSMVVSYVNFKNATRDDIMLALGETSRQDFELSVSEVELTTVVVTGTRAPQKAGIETNLSRDRVAVLPTVGRNISDLLRTVPQARLTNTEGAISIAGQNNRYNAFYIDGALNNDVFGLAASGTNGGQANIPPISLDAIDQIQVSISPYDASLSGFTGGAINAITKSGTNTVKGSVYYLYRNEKLTGKTPTGPKSQALRLGKFEDKTRGFSIGGPIVKNKIFYFGLVEFVNFERPQSFDISRYSGSTNLAGLNALRDTFLTKYKYDPGGFLDNPEKVSANRVVAKLDWALTNMNRLTLSYRFNDGERYNVSSSSASSINFFNNGYVFPTTSHVFSGELKSTFNNRMNNRLLVTFSNNLDDRGPIGDPFPRVRINDGSGSIFLGPDNSSTVNVLKQKNYNLVDVFRLSKGKHSFSFGTDNELNSVYNAFIQNTFGNYTYNSIADFYNSGPGGARPSFYQVGYSLLDKTDENTAAAAEFKFGRIALFINDEYRPNQNLTFNFGLRADKTAFLTTPATDTFTNNIAIPKFSQYYNLEGARSGLKPNIPIFVSPRLGFTYRIPDENITLRGGAGLFAGRIPLVWPAGIYNNNGINQGGFTANAAGLDSIKKYGFRADPDNQYRAKDVGMSLSKGPLNLISKEFKLPKIFRVSLGIDRQLGKGWTGTLEAFYTKNVNEIYYTNIGILPPNGQSIGPDSRQVYPLNAVMPIVGTSNPYDNAILVSNAKGRKGFSYNYSVSIDKRYSKGFQFNMSYNYGQSVVLHEPTSSVNFSQWRFVETVNGRNYITRSQSDFSPAHRVIGLLSKKFDYLNKAMATTVSLLFTGQSGSPISYVYGQVSSANPGPVRDDASGGNDLIYIPTAQELQGMLFTTNTVQGVAYNQQQQRDAFENYIQNNKYMKNHRGQYAERNGDRLPFTKLLDVKFLQDFNIRVAKRTLQFQISYDIFNFSNMLNRNWGRTYFVSNDNQQVLRFAGYVNATSNLTPQYQFNPLFTQPGSDNNISTSSAPSYSARWTSQLGLRLNF
jgi:hypothetical protein